MNGPPTRGSRALAGAEVGLGSALLIAPHRVLTLIGEPTPSTPALVTGRLLGARLLAQSVALATQPRRRTLQVVAGVEALHALSMIALAVVNRRERRVALASAAAAAIQAGAALLVNRSRR